MEKQNHVMSLKSFTNSILSVIKNILCSTARGKTVFKSSGEYSDGRYKAGGDSGVGSYSKVTLFKAEIINRFVQEHIVETIIEFGCRDGNQLSATISRITQDWMSARKPFPCAQKDSRVTLKHIFY